MAHLDPKRDGSEDEGEDEELDPRVEGALGELNSATDDINRSEKDLEAAKKAFKIAMQQVQIDLASLVHKIGKKNVDKARPYHNALNKAKRAHFDARRAASQYEQASGSQKKWKILVSSLEIELMKGGSFNASLQQKLNQATQSVMEADKRKRKAAEAHSRTTQAFLEADEELMNFAKTRKKIILRTQPYFSSKEKHDKILLNLKEELMKHENGVKNAKSRVASALKQLEDISMEIHESRKKKKENKLVSPKGSHTVTQAIADAQADALRREKAEQERQAQEEAEQEAAEAAKATAVSEEDVDLLRNNDDREFLSANDEVDRHNDSIDISEEEIRLMIREKLAEDDVLSSEVIYTDIVANSEVSANADSKDDAERITV